MQRKHVLVLASLSALLCVLAASAAGADAEGQSVSAEFNSSHLRIQEPVSIYGPFPRLVREVTTNDLIELQVSYPVAPPFPKRIALRVENRALTALWIASTDGEIVALTPKPQTGKVGMGYISAYVKANNAGQSKAEVTVTLADGTKKVVPFAFLIRERDRDNSASAQSPLQGEYVYVYPFPLKATDRLCDGTQGKPMELTDGTRLVWSDLLPRAKLAHPTLYELFDGANARTVKGEWWPEHNGQRILDTSSAPLLLRPR